MTMTRRSIFAVVLISEGAAEQRRHTEHVENFRRYRDALEQLRFIRVRQVAAVRVNAASAEKL